MTVLQSILYPSEEVCTCADLYWHDSDAGRAYDGYFNLFSSGKWAAYTELNSVALQLEVRDACEICIWSEQGLLSSHEIHLTKADEAAGTESVTITLPAADRQKFLWFSVKSLLEDSARDPLARACYVTDQEPIRSVRSAIAICTYRREDYVKCNLRALGSAILQNLEHPLCGKLDIFVVDNGQTLRKEEIAEAAGGSSHVHLIPNRNAGGAGGFTRGMLEVLGQKEAEGYTHIILTDDDAVLEPDAFLRCHAFLSSLKPAYWTHCIAGIMLDQEEPYRIVEVGALYRDGRPQPVSKGRDLRGRTAVMDNEQPLQVDYAGWWWACFPLDVVRNDNLPMPYFIHFDDMEYGLRNRGKVLHLNGICVWHEDFKKRRPQTDLYYGTRNRMITNAIHGSGSLLRQELTMCLSEMVMGVMRYQYSASELVLEAVKDFTGGPKHFAHIDPEVRNRQIREMTDEYVPLEKLTPGKTVSSAELAGSIHSPADARVSRRRYLLTLNGWLLPARRSGNKPPVCCSIFSPDMRALYRAKEGILFDPYTEKGTRVYKDYKKALHCVALMVQVMVLLLTRYRVCVQAYRKHAGKLRGREFWTQYLGLCKKNREKTI